MLYKSRKQVSFQCLFEVILRQLFSKAASQWQKKCYNICTKNRALVAYLSAFNELRIILFSVVNMTEKIAMLSA